MDKLTANELRIGNLVRLFLGVGDNGAEYKEYEINGVYTDPYGSSHWLLGNTWIQISDNLQTIPLTEEWLLRFGAIDLDATHYKQFGLGERLIIVRDGKFVDYGSSVILEYVHTLQNFIFALTGEELTITTN